MLLQVLFLRQRQKFEEVDTSSFCVNRQYKIFSEDADIDMQYQRLLEHRCKLCLSIEPFRTFQNLRDHIQREHILFYCDLCVNNLKVLTLYRCIIFYNIESICRIAQIYSYSFTSCSQCLMTVNL